MSKNMTNVGDHFTVLPLTDEQKADAIATLTRMGALDVAPCLALEVPA